MNTAISNSFDPINMAYAMNMAVKAERIGFYQKEHLKYLKPLKHHQLIYLTKMNKKLNNNCVYLITPDWLNVKKIIYITLKSIKSGIKQLQYRNKIINLFFIKFNLFLILRFFYYILIIIINDFLNFCIDINSDGLYLGLNDLKNINYKRLICKKIIGLSCYNSLFCSYNFYIKNLSYISIGGFYKSCIKKYNFNTNFKILNDLKKIML